MQVKNTLIEVGTVEGRTQMMGNRMSIMLTPVATTAVKASSAAKPSSPAKPPAAPKPAEPK
jgi:hypothetical protein